MTEIEFTSYMKYLGTAYRKEYTQEELELNFDFLREYSSKVFANAIKSIIRRSKFAPSISELIEECDKQKENYKNDVLEYMKKCGYFKAPQEYDKAVQWLLHNNVPSWFKEDMNEYAKQMNNSRLETKERILIGG